MDTYKLDACNRTALLTLAGNSRIIHLLWFADAVQEVEDVEIDGHLEMSEFFSSLVGVLINRYLKSPGDGDDVYLLCRDVSEL